MKILNLSKILLFFGIFYTKHFDLGYHFLGLERSSEFLGLLFRFADLALLITISSFFLITFSTAIKKIVNGIKNYFIFTAKEDRSTHSTRQLSLPSFKRTNGIFLAIFTLSLSLYWFYQNPNTLFSFKTGFLTLIAFVISTTLCLKYNPKWLLVLIPYFCFDHILLSSTVAASIFLTLGLLVKWSHATQTTSMTGKIQFQKYFPLLLFIIGFTNLALALYQVKSGHSLGLFWLGEPNLNISNTNGIAKQILPFSNQVLLRGYGLMPHPNILGFLGVSGILFNAYNQNMKSVFQSNKDIFFKNINLVLSFFIIAVSMSRMAIISLVFYLIFTTISKTNLATLKLLKIFLGQTIIIFAITISVLVCMITFFSLNTRSTSDLYRLDQHQTLVNFIKKEPQNLILGIGPGQFTQHLKAAQITNFEWENQPFYQPFGTILIELGVFGLVLCLILGYKFYKTL